MKGIWLIILLFIGYLVLVFFEKEDIASFIKPILVPVLLLSFYTSVKNKGNYRLRLVIAQRSPTSIFNLPQQHGYVQVGDPSDIDNFSNWFPIHGAVVELNK